MRGWSNQIKCFCAENEETEGSEGQAEYLFGDAELDDDDLYSMEHENPAGLSNTYAHLKFDSNSQSLLRYLKRSVVSVRPAEEPEYLLPQEAFPIRHEIMDHPSAPEPLQEKPESPHVSGSEAESMCLTPMESFSLISVSQLLFSPHLPPKFFCPIVKEMLCYYAEQGDVQTAVSVLIVLGERIRKEIDELTQVRECRFRFLAQIEPNMMII